LVRVILVIASVPDMATVEHRGLELPAHARLTPQRRAVLDAVAEQEGAFTAVDVFQRARKKAPSLGLATTYRTIELLRRTGSARPLGMGDAPLYIRCRPGHHHHLVCLVCGAVEDTELCAAPSPAELRKKHGFSAAAHDVGIYGTCRRCA
jgi:Fur family ferric uptake transcriptional regulator